MLSVNEARTRLLAAFSPLPAEMVPLADLHGRVLASPFKADMAQPPSDQSAMDGYAIDSAAFKPGKIFTIKADIAAGHPWDGAIKADECARIFTGAPLPKGTDCVIIQENAYYDKNGNKENKGFMPEKIGEKVQFDDQPKAGQWVRKAGLDFSKDQILAAQGQLLNVRLVGLLASGGASWLPVYRRPRVAILSSGDELVWPGQARETGQIINSNGPALAAFLKMGGAIPQMLPIARDQIDDLQLIADQAKDMDLIISSGGASVGRHDLIQTALTSAGLSVDFWKIAMRPGKPMIFGHLNETPFLGLPGNPVSALVCAMLFIWPALLRLQGLPDPGLVYQKAMTTTELPANDARESFWRARIIPAQKEQIKTPSDSHRQISVWSLQDSSMQTMLAEADCLVRRAPDAPAAAAGDLVDILDMPHALLTY